MATPRLILRFKEFNAELDTVLEHNEIIKSHGLVLWGWWKKEHEPDQVVSLRKLTLSSSFEIRLLNRDDKRLFRVNVSGILLNNKNINIALVPEYYRRYTGDISTWFQFSSPIEEMHYDGELASQVGSQTLVLCSKDSKTKRVKARTIVPSINTKTYEKVRPLLIHISDLHFGPGDHNFLMPPDTARVGGPTIDLAQAILSDYRRVAQEDPGILVISGDITSKNHWTPAYRDRIVSSMKKISHGFKVPERCVIIGPGNHDVERPLKKYVEIDDYNVARAINYDHEENFRTFLHEYDGRNRKDPLSGCHIYHCDRFDIIVGSLNSANLGPTKFSEYGYVGAGPLDEVLAEMNRYTSKCVKILVLHHHLVPISSVQLQEKVGVTMTLDANEILRKAQECGIQIILHGHQHTPRVVKFSQAYQKNSHWRGLADEDVYIVASGSAGSKELQRGISNTYTIISFTETSAVIKYRNIHNDGSDAGTYMEISVPVQAK